MKGCRFGIAIDCQSNGQLVGAVQVAPEDDVILISDRGTMVRTPVEQISELGQRAGRDPVEGG